MKANPTKARRKSEKSDRRVAADIMAGVAELHAMVRDGAKPQDRFLVRKLGLPDPPHYSAAAVRKLRKQIGVSQATFAGMLGVSRILVQSWERGVREPSRMARRLLQTIHRDPSAWLAGMNAT
jgi:putative transcriptional regulator